MTGPSWSDLQTLLVSLLPGVFWIVYLRSLSARRVSSWWFWAVALTAGVGSTQLTLLISDVFEVDGLRVVPRVGAILYFVLGVGFVEEACKALCAIVALKAPGLLRNPLVSIQLCGAVALGFATTENILYAYHFGDGVILGRFVFSTLGHVLFSAFWGASLGPNFRAGTFTGFLLLSAVAHGLYDWFLMTERPALAILILIVLWMGFREASLGAYLREDYQRESPFELMPCRHCSVLTRAEGVFCSYCGEAIGELPVAAAPPER